MAGAVRRFFDLLAKMGLSVRDDPPKVIDPSARQWSAAVAGLALSVSPIPAEEPDSVPGLSIVLRNVGTVPVSLELPGWLSFYRIEIEGAELTAYGRALLSAERSGERRIVRLGPGAFADTQVPLGAMYSFQAGTPRRVSVTCDVPGASQLLSASVSIM